MHILDTDTLTHLYAGHPRVIERLHAAEDPDIGTTIITKVEMLRGRFEFLLKAANGEDLLRAQHWLDRTEDLLAQIIVIPVDEVVATQFNRLRTMKNLRKIGRADLLVASIALTHRAVLVTRNRRHFQQVPGLKVLNWVD